ncbi:MAG: MBL fold metallo-hydrolase, partial [Pseudomonadota bacterium]
MPVEIVTVPCLSDNYAYLVRDHASGEVAVVDAPEAGPIIDALDARGWSASQMWITHHHPDHVDGVPALVERYGVKTVGHGADKARLPELDLEVLEGDSISLGDSTARIIDVSGHTIGHIALIMDADNVAFTADSLMALGCGRVFEGTHSMMWDSLSKFLGLPDEMMIYSGHNYGVA